MLKFRAILVFLFLCLPLAPALARSEPKCKVRTLVFPPSVNDVALGLWLSRTAVTNLREHKFFPCLRVVRSDKANETLSFIGFSAYDKISINDLKSKHFKILMDDLNVKQIILLDYVKGNNPQLLASFYRLQLYDDGTIDAEGQRNFRIPLNQGEVSSKKSSFLHRYLPYFVPNAVAFGGTLTEIDMTTTVEYEVINTESKSKIPAILSSLSFSRIDHPDSFNHWDATFAASPRIFLFSLDQTTKIAKKPLYADADYLEVEKDLRIKAFGGCTTVDGTGSLITPIGTSYLSLGIGPCLYGIQPEDEFMTIRPDLGISYFFGHNVFITRQWFVSLDAGGIIVQKPLYNTEYARSSNISRVSFTLGYYFPNVENRMDRAW